MKLNCNFLLGYETQLQFPSSLLTQSPKLNCSTAAGFVKLFSNLGQNAGNLAGPVGVMQV